MGYFAYAYIVEAIEDETSLTTTRTVYSVDLAGPDARALFSWDQGIRPAGMHSYADGTLFCSHPLRELHGYPLVRRQPRDEAYEIEEGFLPGNEREPVLYHLLLPDRFVPRPDLPLQQPMRPNVARHKNRLIVSYGVTGRADIQFTIERLRAEASFDDYELNRVLEVPASSSTKLEVEINLGIFKLKFS